MECVCLFTHGAKGSLQVDAGAQKNSQLTEADVGVNASLADSLVRQDFSVRNRAVAVSWNLDVGVRAHRKCPHRLHERATAGTALIANVEAACCGVVLNAMEHDRLSKIV